MSKVVDLKTKQAIKGAVDDKVVSLLESALEKAKAGDINGIVMLFHHSDESTSVSNGGSVSFSVVGRLHEMSAYLIQVLNDQ